MTREEKLNKRREAGKTYKYKPNPYEKGTGEYFREKNFRARKTTNRLPFAKWTSIMAKLENQLNKERTERAEKSRSKKAGNV